MTTARRQVTVYTDGSSRQQRHGGYGATLLCDGFPLVLVDYLPNATNNQAELMAVIAALQVLTEPCDVTVFSDSRYVVDGINKNLQRWQTKGWHGTMGPIANREMWEKIWHFKNVHQVQANWVRGHNGDPNNEIVDSLAQLASTWH